MSGSDRHVRPVSRTARHQGIVAALQATQQVNVGALAERFGVTAMTIRRDLAELDGAGQLQRIHGGAVLRRAPAYGSRTTVMGREKARIARAVAGLVGDGEAVGIDAGTTCRAVAAELAGRRDADLTAVTYSLHAATEFQAAPTRTVVLGGVLTPELTLVSGGAADIVSRVHLDTLVLGCAGVSVERGLTFFDPAEVEVRRALLAVSDRVVLACDHTKFDRRTAIVLAGLEVLDVVVSDAEPPPLLAAALADAGVAWHVAD